MRWPDIQRDFADAVRDPKRVVPDAVGTHDGRALTSRFNVYRNNSAVSLTEAVRDTFPVVAELVGNEFFRAMARAYVSEHIPSSPVLIHYGGTFPPFIEQFEPARRLPYLADVARVEWAWLQAYHAADSDHISAASLESFDPVEIDNIQLSLHPSVHLIRSAWPVLSLWSAHQLSDAGQRGDALQQIAPIGECGLIMRPGVDVEVRLLDEATFNLLAAFAGGATLGEAMIALDEASVEQFGGRLGYIFSAGTIAAVGLR